MYFFMLGFFCVVVARESERALYRSVTHPQPIEAAVKNSDGGLTLKYRGRPQLFDAYTQSVLNTNF